MRVGQAMGFCQLELGKALQESLIRLTFKILKTSSARMKSTHVSFTLESFAYRLRLYANIL